MFKPFEHSRAQSLCALRRQMVKRFGTDQFPLHLIGDRHQARGKIDGRTNCGEIQPRLAADVAIVNIAKMQRSPESQIGAFRRNQLSAQLL